MSPQIFIVSWATSGLNPSGGRYSNLTSSGFIKTLSTHAGTGFLEMGIVNNSSGTVTSDTKVIFGRLTAMNDASEKVYNMKFWAPDLSAWGGGTYRFNHEITSIWTQNKTISSSAPAVPTTLPISQNIFNAASGTELKVALHETSGISSYVYLSNTIGNDVDPGVYGSTGFRYRVSIEYY